MASTLTWLDYSERDRRRALDVIDLFRESGTVDELGLAPVRDSFSDLFFPGASTIQTRACYFLLVPWTFLRMERLRVSSSQAEAKARQMELELNAPLLAGDDTKGVFGSQAGNALKRLPSEVYWGGLGSWGIRAFPGHKWAYFRSLDRFYRVSDRFRGQGDAEGSAQPANWNAHLPCPPRGFPREAEVALRRHDAEYLRDRILATHPGSLLALLAGRADSADLEADAPWEHSRLDGVPAELRDGLWCAELLSVFMQGSALLYNLMLSELRRDDGRTETYRHELSDWAVDVEALGSSLSDRRLEEVWRIVESQGRSLGCPTKRFVTRWVKKLEQDGPTAMTRHGAAARELVREREVQLKGRRSRLGNSRRLELWGGRSGTVRMDFRWGAAKRLLRDIFDGLSRDAGDAGYA